LNRPAVCHALRLNKNVVGERRPAEVLSNEKIWRRASFFATLIHSPPAQLLHPATTAVGVAAEPLLGCRKQRNTRGFSKSRSSPSCRRYSNRVKLIANALPSPSSEDPIYGKKLSCRIEALSSIIMASVVFPSSLGGGSTAEHQQQGKDPAAEGGRGLRRRSRSLLDVAPEFALVDESKFVDAEGTPGRHSDKASEENTITNIFDNIRGGCQISNDPLAEDELPPLNYCNETAYLCAPPREEEDEEIFHLSYEISYDYEIYYNPESSLGNILPFIEESNLEHLASAMGLTNCKAVLEGGRRRKRLLQKGRRLDSFSDEQIDSLEGISLLPRDTPDDSVQACTSSIPTKDAEAAGGGEEDEEEEMDCVPVKGAVTVFTTVTEEVMESFSGLFPQDEASLRQAVLNEIKSGMEDDLYVAPGHISKVST